MELALFLVGMAVIVLAVTALADVVDFPAPLFLIAVGIGLSFLPGVPEVELEPEIVLLGLLPPLLYSAALQTSLVDFNAHRRVILLLSVGLVVFTTFGIGWLVHELLPGVGWPAALAIGAVVAPPDAVAATTIGRRIGLPRRIVTILEGESLLNDATALVALRTAIAAAGLGITAFEVGVDFVVAAGGGVAVGLAMFMLVAFLRKRITDPVFDTGMSFLVPFAAYVAAEEVHASGVVAVVVAGLLLGHKAPIIQTAQSRIAERMNWRTIAWILENAVFLLIGLQAQALLSDVQDSEVSSGRIVLVCASTLVGVIVLRMVWVFISRFLLVRPSPDPTTGLLPTWQGTFLVGWAGMRGVVTLAAAYVIPKDFEHREVLLLIAFTVVAGTLFLQGLTLPVLARMLDVPGPDPVDDALARATLLQQASKAGLKALDEMDVEDPHGVIDLVRQRIDQRNFSAWERMATTADEEAPSDLYSRVRRTMIDAERGRVLEIRKSGTVPSEVVADVLAMLDVEESLLETASAEREDIQRQNQVRRRFGQVCDDLEQYPTVDEHPATFCEACVVEGTRWVALRRCLVCGDVGCCDSSPRQHATRHFHETTHAVMQSAEPDEDWRWCYVHHLTG